MDASRSQANVYDRIAERASGYQTTYDVRVDGLSGEDEFIVTVFDHVGLNDTVLDLGCGDGSFTVRLGHRSARVIGADVTRPCTGSLPPTIGSRSSLRKSSRGVPDDR